MPECPRCGASIFRLDSIFESMQEHGATTIEYEVAEEDDVAEWLDGVRVELAAGVRRLAYRDEDGETRVVPIRPGWTRIGRSVAADVRLDDPSVSRRHALIVSEADHSLRVLDDRSLNGVFVNGELVDWGKLDDGDELTVGRYHLFVLEG
jgi:FHA domain-containing protein